MKKSDTRKGALAPRLSIGLDLGSETAVAAMISQAGEVIGTKEFALTPEVLSERFAVAPMVILIESATVARWVHDLLVELGHEVVVCNPRRLKLIAASTLKTDKLDAIVLGRLARLYQLDPDLVQASVVRTRETQLRRSQLGVRDLLVRQRTQCISSIKNILKADALPLEKGDEGFRKNVEALDLPDDVRSVIRPLLEALATLDAQLAVIKKELEELAKKIPITKAWRDIDGIGLLTSLALALTIEDPSRFPKARDIGPYLGFTPRLRESSDSTWRGHCTKAGDDRTRRYLIQAAHCMRTCKQDSALKQWSLGIEGRVGKKKAVNALARKLAVVMQAMWQSGEAYAQFPDNRVNTAA